MSYSYHGGTGTSEYGIFEAAKSRCNTTTNPAYAKYGGRGIRFLFESFEEFRDVMGRRPSADHSLDRIDNDGPYSPANCRWATRRQQCLNRWVGYKLQPGDPEDIHRLAAKGVSQKEIARRFAVSQCHVSRVLSGKRRPLSHI